MSDNDHHFAKSIFFSCIDDRLVDSHYTFVKQINGAFCADMAGGGLALISPEQSQAALEQIIDAYKINHIDHVYIESHIDCGAYLLSGVTFIDRESEVGKLYADLETAKSAVQSALIQAGAQAGEVTVLTRVVDFNNQLLRVA